MKGVGIERPPLKTSSITVTKYIRRINNTVVKSVDNQLIITFNAYYLNNFWSTRFWSSFLAQLFVLHNRL